MITAELKRFQAWLEDPGTIHLGGVPDGYDARILTAALEAVTKAKSKGEGAAQIVYVARDGQRAADCEAALSFFAPWADVLHLPAWDCLPYDRVSPSNDVLSKRIAVLSRLASGVSPERPTVITLTPNALLQLVPPRAVMAKSVKRVAPGNRFDMEELVDWLARNGFQRTPTVRDAGDFAVRGGILDLFAPGTDAPVRLDFFGDTVESIRSFDAATQRTEHQLKQVTLAPMSEVTLDAETIARFRTQYLKSFGAAAPDDALYAAVSDGRRYAGMEHWLPLYFERLETVFDYLDGSLLLFDNLVDEALQERNAQIVDHFEARKRNAEERNAASDGGTPYKPVEPETLYLTPQAETALRESFDVVTTSPFDSGDDWQSRSGIRTMAMNARQGRSFAAERAASDVNIFSALASHVADLLQQKKTVVIASWSVGSRERLAQVLEEHDLTRTDLVDTWADVEKLRSGHAGLAVLGIESGFEDDQIAVIGEQDVLGDRLVKRSAGKRKASDFLSEVSSLSVGDVVVHVDHGIARFHGLVTIEAAGAPHDCLELRYHGDDKLFLPVENIELLSRYGSSDTEVQLDRLGGANWQARKAKLKKRILEMAGKLIEIAAARMLKRTDPISPPAGVYDEFAARFPYEETEDQMNAIDSVMDDLASGRPMDRLICGDVGFGKTEVALRAAFLAAMEGRQVAVVVPTTLRALA